jgi:hypothetical protein
MKNNTQKDNEAQPPCLTPAHDDDGSSVSLTEEEEKEWKEVVGAAAVTGAVAGMAIGGPAAAVVSGAGAAYLVASSNNGCIGSATRATGEAVLGLKDKAAQWEEDHHYVGNAAQSATKKRVKDWEEKHNYVQKTKEVAKTRWEKLQEFGENHHVLEHIQKFTERTYQTITKGTSVALFKIRQCVHPDVTTSTIADSQKE